MMSTWLPWQVHVSSLRLDLLPLILPKIGGQQIPFQRTYIGKRNSGVLIKGLLIPLLTVKFCQEESAGCIYWTPEEAVHCGLPDCSSQCLTRQVEVSS